MGIEPMSRRRCVGLWLFALTMLVPVPAWARLGSIPNIRTITNDSNLIVVAEVVSTRTLGPAEWTDSHGARIAGLHNVTAFRVEEVLTGKVDGSLLQVEYNRNPEMDADPTPVFDASAQMMIFLHCVAEVCSFTNPGATDFRVTRRKSNLAPLLAQPEDVYLRVLQRLGAGLFADAYEGRRSGESPREVYLIDSERDPYVATLFHASLLQSTTLADVDLRGALIAALVRRGEDSMLPDLQEVLFTGDLYSHTNMRENLILSLQQINWHLSLPIVAKALVVPVPELRTVAARALEHLPIAVHHSYPNELSEPATKILLTSLHDPNPQVVFAVMQSLGDLNGRHDERPLSTVPDEQWMECLRFWESFQGGSK